MRVCILLGCAGVAGWLAVPLMLAQSPESVAMSELRPETVVAEVNGKEITYGEIRIAPSALAPLAERGWNSAQVRDFKKASEFTNLRRIIDEALASQAVARYDVKVSDAAVEQRAREFAMDRFGKPLLTPEDARRQNEEMQAVNNLIETWQQNHEEGEALYKQKFVDKLSETAWEYIKRNVATSKALEALKKSQPAVNADAMNVWIKDRVIKQLIREELVKKLRSLGLLKPDEDYLDWLYRQLVSVKVVRGDVIPFSTPALESASSALSGSGAPSDPPGFGTPRLPGQRPELNTPPVPLGTKGK